MYIAQKELRGLVETAGLIGKSDRTANSRLLLAGRLMRLCGADYAASFAWNNNLQCFEEAVFENMDAGNIDRYNQYFQYHDPITHNLSCFRRAVAVREVMPYKYLEKTEFFNDFLQKDGLTFGINLFVYSGEKLLFDFRLWRSKKQKDFEDSKLKMLDSLMPALQSIPQSSTHQVKVVPNFTPRESQVIGLLRNGMCDKSMAKTLDISVTTIRTHVRNIYERTGVHSRTELISVL